MKEKLVVVAGATGKLGHLIVAALLREPQVRVRALVRDPHAASAADLRRDRVELVPFDVLAAEGHEDAVGGAFTVISALQGGPDILVDGQRALLRAAKARGARRFIASDYAFDIFGLPTGMNVAADWRRTFAEHAHTEISTAFDVVHVLNGMFLDRTVFAFLELIDVERGVLRYWGDEKAPIDLTTWEDTAAFTAAAALDDRTVPERLCVSAGRIDTATLASTWGSTRGRAVTLERLGSLADLERETDRRRAAGPDDLFAWLPLMYARGVFGGEALLRENHNALYPTVKPETIAASIARGAL